eukprot:6051898-Prymnesium_polylepis.2
MSGPKSNDESRRSRSLAACFFVQYIIIQQASDTTATSRVHARNTEHSVSDLGTPFRTCCMWTRDGIRHGH